MLADIGDTRTKDAKCAEAGFTPKHVYRLLKDPEFCRALDDATTVSVRAHRARVYMNLLRASDSGDTQASTTFLKGAGDIAGGTQVNTVVNQGGDDKGFAERLREARKERDVAYERERVLRQDNDG